MDATTILANMLREGRATVNEVRAINEAYRDGVLTERRRCADAVHRAAKDFYGNTDQMYAAALIVSAIESAQ